MGNFHSLYCAYNTLSCIMKIRINGNENVTKQSKENEVYMKKTTLEEKLGYNQKGAKKELKMEPIER